MEAICALFQAEAEKAASLYDLDNPATKKGN
jgi:hypothetical protein